MTVHHTCFANRHSKRGQATVEFALLLPLVIACMAVVLVAGMLVHDQLALSETARLAVRLAIVSDDPINAVAQVIEQVDSQIHAHTIVDDSTGLITVVLQKKRQVPMFIFQSAMPHIELSARAVMAMEPPVSIAS